MTARPRSVALRIAQLMERISSLLGPRAMRYIARVNKYVTNPIQRLWAARAVHMAIIEHRGRRSGATYQTPVMAFVEGNDLVVVLNYGTNADWVRNVRAAGSAVVRHRGHRFTVAEPRVLPVDSPDIPAALRSIDTMSHSVLHATLRPT